MPVPGAVDLGWWTISPEWLAAYLEATADDGQVPGDGGVVPPLALAARALAGLLEVLELPAGAIHGAQEITCQRAARVGERVRIAAEVARPTQRGDFRFISAGFSAFGEQNDTILTGKSTVILPPDAAGEGEHP